MVIKRFLLVATLCSLSFLLAACQAQSLPPATLPAPDHSAEILSELRYLRNEIAQIRARQEVLPADHPVPIDETSEIESITYSRATGRILVVYSRSNSAIAAVNSASKTGP